MRIFITEDEFTSFLPNILPVVGNEVKLLDKLNSYIAAAEERVIRDFTGQKVFDDICGLPVEERSHGALARLVLSLALHEAIPAIDIVVTPNGLATVGTQTLVAASRARVESLMNSLLVIRDDAINALLAELRYSPDWRASERGTYYRETLFPDFVAVEALGTRPGERWEKWLELRPQIQEIEEELAQGYISPELMCQLRAEVLAGGSLSEQRAIAAARLRNMICVKLSTGHFNSRALSDLVNYIRNYPDAFSLWHESETAKLFEPPVFKNEKKSSGYFFSGGFYK